MVAAKILAVLFSLGAFVLLYDGIRDASPAGIALALGILALLCVMLIMGEFV